MNEENLWEIQSVGLRKSERDSSEDWWSDLARRNRR